MVILIMLLPHPMLLAVIDWREIHWWPVVAGLGLFLFGMYMLEEALKNLAGRSFKIFLRRYTGNRIKAILSGTIVTMLLQSSTLVTILVMSLAGAGVIGMSSGIGMILGANLGTTATGWLVSLVGFKMNIETLIMPLMAIGGLGIAFLKTEKLASFSKLLMGFSIMFLGLNYMKNSFVAIATHVDLSSMQDSPFILFVMFGFVFTALIQSSSASMTIYLSSLAAGIITLPQAAFLIIGSDVGTSVTGLIGSLNGNAMRRKIGLSQFFFNVLNAVIALLIFTPLFYVIKQLLHVSDPLFSLVLFHSLFNLAGILFLLPFLNFFIGLMERYVKGEVRRVSRYISSGNPAESVSGIELLEKETVVFMEQVLTFNSSFFISSDTESTFLSAYLNIKQYENEISQFFLSMKQLKITRAETLKLTRLTDAVRQAALSAKDLKDVQHNIAALRNAVSPDATLLLSETEQRQQKFNAELMTIFAGITTVAESDLNQLNEMQRKFYNDETTILYHSIPTLPQEVDLSSMLNMLRAINRSNEYAVNAVQSLLPEKG
jgi:phosphate:Na+ symporter